jgi:hypothetical protein
MLTISGSFGTGFPPIRPQKISTQRRSENNACQPVQRASTCWSIAHTKKHFHVRFCFKLTQLISQHCCQTLHQHLHHQPVLNHNEFPHCLADRAIQTFQPAVSVPLLERTCVKLIIFLVCVLRILIACSDCGGTRFSPGRQF